MSVTTSRLLGLGEHAPAFRLADTVSGKMVGLDDLAGPRATVVLFICNHCPYVKHVQSELVRLAKDYGPQGVGFVAISSNDVNSYPDDGPIEMKRVAEQLGFPFPYLYDESQDVARDYTAMCTPDPFVFDSRLRLVYRGQLDDTRPSSTAPANGKTIRAVIDSVLAGRPVDANQKPSVGCSIKWKD